MDLHLHRKVAQRFQADLNPPLGKPGGPCQVVRRIDEEIQNPKLKSLLTDKVEDGESLSNPEAAKVYDVESERAKGLVTKFLVGPHTQYRMDLRKVSIKDVQRAFAEWSKEVHVLRKDGDPKYEYLRGLLNSGDKIRYTSPQNLTIVFTGEQKGVVKVVTTWWQGVADPPPPGTCEVHAKEQPMYCASERVAYRFMYAKLVEAMSLDEAWRVLGLPPGTSDQTTIMKAWRSKAFMNHPDRGGDPTTMVEVNVAKDVLIGKQRPTVDRGPTPPPPEPSPPAEPRTSVKPLFEAASFKEAAQGKLSNVYWMWVTEWKNFEPESFEARELGALDTGWVAYGRHADSGDHVFLPIGTGMFTAGGVTHGDRETWWVGTPVKISKKVPTPRAVDSGQAKATNQIKGLPRTNVIFTLGGLQGRRYIEQKDLENPGWAPTTIKKWLDDSGYGKDTPLRLTVEVRTGPRGSWDRQVAVTINGHENVFSDRGREAFFKDLGPKIFSKNDLGYGGKKDLIRMKNPGWALLLLWKQHYDELAPADAEALKKYLQQIGVYI